MHATGKYLQRLMGPAISDGSFKSTKTIYHLTRLAMESLKFLLHFCSLNGECVTYVCLQCGRYKQNHYRFLGKIATIDKCAVSLRVISIAYLFGQHFELNPCTVDKFKLKL